MLFLTVCQKFDNYRDTIIYRDSKIINIVIVKTIAIAQA